MKSLLHLQKNLFQSLHGKVKPMMIFGGASKKRSELNKVGNQILFSMMAEI
jgi:hypothetical protein